MNPADSWRDSLVEQLRAAGGPALEMMDGSRPADPLVLLHALEAAGLLSAGRAASEGLDELRVALARGAARAPQVKDALEALGTPPDIFAQDPIERGEALEQLVALAGIASIVPLPTRRPVDRTLEAARAAIVATASPLDPRTLRQADFLRKALDLPADHPASELLDEVLAAASQPDPAMVRAAVERARPRVLGLPWLRWARGLSEAARAFHEWLDERTLIPAMAAAADDEPAPPELCPLGTVGSGQLVALYPGNGTLLVLWGGEGSPPRRICSSGRALPSADLSPWPSLAGMQGWTLHHPPRGPLELRCEWPGGSQELRLA